MTRRKHHGDADLGLPDDQDTPEVSLGAEAPAESFAERTDEADAARARLSDVGLIPKPDRRGRGPTTEELTAAENPRVMEAPSNEPWWFVETVCPTPVEPRTLVLQAETEDEARALYRRATGLDGAVAGGIPVRPASDAEIQTELEARG